MKTSYLLFILIFTVFSCIYENKEDTIKYLEPLNPIRACGVDDPLNELKWLYDTIINSQNEPNFVERIWIKIYNEQDIIVIQYSVSSVFYHTYDCQGERIEIHDLSFFNSITDSEMIYLDLG